MSSCNHLALSHLSSLQSATTSLTRSSSLPLWLCLTNSIRFPLLVLILHINYCAIKSKCDDFLLEHFNWLWSARARIVVAKRKNNLEGFCRKRLPSSAYGLTTAHFDDNSIISFHTIWKRHLRHCVHCAACRLGTLAAGIAAVIHCLGIICPNIYARSSAFTIANFL